MRPSGRPREVNFGASFSNWTSKLKLAFLATVLVAPIDNPAGVSPRNKARRIASQYQALTMSQPIHARRVRNRSNVGNDIFHS